MSSAATDPRIPDPVTPPTQPPPKPDDARRSVLPARSTAARGHRDDELNDPRVLSDRRLLDIVGECVSKWDAFPTIPGSRRWFRNGGVALAEIERRLIERG
jgi:hypothetical protein